MGSDRLRRLDAELERHEWFWIQMDELDNVVACDLAKTLEPAEWTELDSIWRTRSNAWKACFAVVLGATSRPNAGQWLLELAVSASDDVAYLASIQLKDLRRAGKIDSLPASARDPIRQLWTRRNKFTTKQLKEVLDDMFA